VVFVRQAAALGCHLAVLPEFHLTNWIPTDPGFANLCQDWNVYLQRYQQLAKELGICIVPGTIVRPYHPPNNSTGNTDDKTPQALENVAFFISNDGSILGEYIKKNLWGPTERQFLVSNSAPHRAIDTPLGKIGLLICWDLAFPEAWRALVRQGAKIIIVPTLWTRSGASEAGHRHNPSAESLFLDSILTARCYENTCAVVFANAGGPPGRNYCGLSQVTAPYTGPLCRLGSSTEGMAVCDLDMQILEDAEDNYSIRSDLARPDWHYGYLREGERDACADVPKQKL
jgi:predicted amidohydrolase